MGAGGVNNAHNLYYVKSRKWLTRLLDQCGGVLNFGDFRAQTLGIFAKPWGDFGLHFHKFGDISTRLFLNVPSQNCNEPVRKRKT